MKSFSTVRDTWRGSQSYMEKRRGRREIEVTRRRRGGIKRGESKLASNQFPMCSPSLDSSEMFMELHREGRGRKETEVDRRLKAGGIKRREKDPGSNQFPKCSPQHGTPREFHRVK